MHVLSKLNRVNKQREFLADQWSEINPKKKKNIGNRIITTYINLIVKLNNVVFNFQNYLQVTDCAMCTNGAPSYANMYMGLFEERYICPLIETMV